MKPFLYMTKKSQDRNLNIFGTKKAFFIFIFKGLSVAKNLSDLRVRL